MNAEQWSSIEQHFDRLNALPSGERESALSAIADPDIRHEVASLLQHSDEGETYAQAISAISEHVEAEDYLDKRLGPYRLVRRLGQGGQGTVFEGVRDDGTFRQRVAVKVIKWEMDSAVARERFRQERQILAAIEHPYVARLLDGGQTENGSPYLVMEFVEGRPLMSAVAGWTQRRKLEIFLKICQAVAHAHHNLVVHRDLKPANIMVTGTGDPKLLDFGIAKLIDPEATRTQTGMMSLTPDFASPEQVRGAPITTASDIYSLGVVLYLLLTGRKPYTLDTTSYAQLDRVICEEPPAHPGLGDELDPILMMALRKEPERRYPSVEQFAGDINNFLEHRPVLARPDTLRYRAGKYVRRHWISVVAALVALTGVCAGAGVAVYQARVAKRQFNQVRQLANRFLFDFDAKIANIPGTVEAREMVVSTALEYLGRLSSEASGDPGLQWELAEAYGKVALVQGSFNRPSLRRPHDAAISYEKAFALTRPLVSQHWLNVKQRGTLIDILCEAEVTHRVLKEYDAARRVGQEAIDVSEGVPGWPRVRALGEMAITLGAAGDLVGSLHGMERQLPAVRETLLAESSYTNRERLASVLYNLGVAHMKLTAFAEAQAAVTEALGLFQSLVKEHPRDVRARRWVFQAFMRLGDIDGACDRPSLGKTREAVDFYEQSIAVMEPLVADAHDFSSRNDVGLVEMKAAGTLVTVDPKQAVPHATRAMELLAASRGAAGHHGPALVLASQTHLALGETAIAEKLQQQAAQEIKSNAEGWEALLANWARLEVARGRRDSAANYIRELLAESEKSYREISSPLEAWGLTEDLDLAASIMPDSAPQFRERIAAVWADQNRRFPGHPWIEHRMSEARSAATQSK